MAVRSGSASAITDSALGAFPVAYASNGILRLSEKAQALLNYLPQYMQEGENVRSIDEIIGSELQRAVDIQASTVDQVFASTATWALNLWEQMLNLPIGADSEDTYETRQNTVLSFLQGGNDESEYWFVERIKALVGEVYVKDLDPSTHPYEVEVEVVAAIVEEPPKQSVTASVIDPIVDIEVVTEGSPADSEVQKISLAETVSGGTFTLTFDSQTTAPIAYDATSATIASELNALSSIGGAGGSVTASGGPLPSSPVEITFGGSLGNTNVFDMTGDGTSLLGNLDGQYTYRVTFGYPTGETTAGWGELLTNEIQTISSAGSVTGGTFTITYDDMLPPNNPPNPQTTAPLPFDATPQQVKDALMALSNISDTEPAVILVQGGPVNIQPMTVEFINSLSGQAQVLLAVDSSGLTGGGNYDTVVQTQAGATTYEHSESNTVLASDNHVLLTNIPRSFNGATSRKIYRRKNPDTDYYFIGEISNDDDTTFVDTVDDAEALLNDTLSEYNTATNTLGSAVLLLIARTKPAHLRVTVTSSYFRASINVAGDPV